MRGRWCGQYCSDHRYMMIAGDTPKATLSESESSSAPNRLAPFSIRAMRPSMPSSTAATMIAATAAPHWPEMAKRMPVRPEQSASAVTALGTTARKGMPRRSDDLTRDGSRGVSLGDALARGIVAELRDHRLPGNGALPEQHV